MGSRKESKKTKTKPKHVPTTSSTIQNGNGDDLKTARPVLFLGGNSEFDPALASLFDESVRFLPHWSIRICY